MRRSKMMVALAALLTLLSGFVPTAGAAPAAAHHRGLSWRPCPAPAPPGLDCATLEVPMDHARPHGATVSLALARRTASDPKARIGSLVINPGGPGGSGVAFAARADEYFSAELRKHFDIVGFDPRGVGGSQPVLCDADVIENGVTEFVKNEAEFAALLAYHKRLGENCRAHTGPLFDHLDTRHVALDLDRIRAALGERTLTYYGLSYGTAIGQQYAELFPGRIRAMALDSNMDHSIGAFRYVASATHDMETSFDQFSQWCIRTPSCELYPKDPRAVLRTLYAKAERGELRRPDAPDEKMEPEQLLDLVLGGMYNLANWHSLAEIFRDLLAGGTGAGAAGARPGPKRSSELVPEPYWAVWCADHQWDVPSYARLAKLRRALNRIAPNTHLSTLAWTDVTGCLGWPGKVTNPQHRLKVHGSPTLLMVNSRHDISTPYPWAVNAARQLGRSAVLLTYLGTGGGVYAPSACGRAAIDGYLIDRKVPARWARCPAVFPDDLAQPSGARSIPFGTARPGSRGH